MTYKQQILIRIYLVLFVLVIFAITILAKAFHIQQIELKDGKKWKTYATKNSALKVISGERGNLYSSDGHLLNTSIPVFDIYFDTHANGLSDKVFNQNIDTLAFLLSKFNNKVNKTKKTKKHYKNFLKKKRLNKNRYVSLFKKLNYDELAEIEKFPIFNLGRNKGGFIVNQKNDRHHPFKELAFRTIGSTGKKDVKAIGLEGYFDRHLSGVKGTQVLKRVTDKLWVPISNQSSVKALNGKDILTTINVKIQDVVHDELNKALYRHNAKYGSAIVMEVETGAIKAIANLSFNEGTNQYHEMFNNAIGKRFEQGSTFKLISMAALLESGKVKLDDKVDIGNGSHSFCEVNMNDASNKEKGAISIEDVFKRSSNVGIAKVVDEVFGTKPNNFFNHLKKFEITESTGISIKGEQMPDFVSPEDEKWSSCVTLPWLSIGYSADISALQLLKFYNTVANDGIAVNPFLVYNRQANDFYVESNQSKFGRKVLSKNVSDKLQHLLRAVVEDGTAKKINSPKIKLAGKTGTSKVYNFEEKKYETDKYHASFIGYFPADNPKYSCAVVISETESLQYYGSQVAAPVFKNIAEQILYIDTEIHDFVNSSSNENKILIKNKKGNAEDHNVIAKELTKNIINTESKWITPKYNNEKLYYRAETITNNKVPNVMGMGLKDAIYILENAGMKVKFSGRGKVSKQSIRAGENIKKGKIISIELT